jgi:isoquinoline 1-oxidoreductase subunit alpha
MKLNVNARTHDIDVPDDIPLLWVLRDELGLTGTKYARGIQQCGACKVHVNGLAVPSSGVLAADVEGKEIITIEALGDNCFTPCNRHGSMNRSLSVDTAKAVS